VRPEEYELLGAITVEAYDHVGHVEPGYADELRDTATKVQHAEVLVAVTADDRVVGGVAYVTDTNSKLAEHDDPEAACFRHLAVAPAAQGLGAGRALVEACIERARAEGKTRIVIHSTTAMVRAHDIYERYGFSRTPDRDWEPLPGLVLWGFQLDLT